MPLRIWPWKKKELTVDFDKSEQPSLMSDADRVSSYVASGGEVVDLSNKDRLPNDGFASDHELMTPYNQAHTGTKQGLAAMAKGDRR